MSVIIQRLKNLTRLNRRRIDTTLLRVHKNPLLMFIVNVFFLTINFFVRLAMAINRLLDDSDLSQSLSAAGLARAAKFTWPRTGAKLMRLYQQVIEGDQEK